MTLEKRGNSEAEVKKRVTDGKIVMILPGSNIEVPYDGRFSHPIKDGAYSGFEKIASLQDGESTFFEV
jgi:hypothetical protein